MFTGDCLSPPHVAFSSFQWLGPAEEEQGHHGQPLNHRCPQGGTQGQGWLCPQPALLSLPARPCSLASRGNCSPARLSFLPIDEQGLIAASSIIQQDFLEGLGAIFSLAVSSTLMLVKGRLFSLPLLPVPGF